MGKLTCPKTGQACIPCNIEVIKAGEGVRDTFASQSEVARDLSVVDLLTNVVSPYMGGVIPPDMLASGAVSCTTRRSMAKCVMSDAVIRGIPEAAEAELFHLSRGTFPSVVDGR